jgi:hypothetical protein
MPYPNYHENQRLKNKTYHTTHDILELSKSPVENHKLGLAKFSKDVYQVVVEEKNPTRNLCRI